MQYILKGFSHELGFRVFTFETMNDPMRTAYSVKADLALARKHGIRVQELPLLCRTLLELRTQHNSEHAYTFSEAEMREHENLCAARMAEAQKRRSLPRKQPAHQAGQSWRGPHL